MVTQDTNRRADRQAGFFLVATVFTLGLSIAGCGGKSSTAPSSPGPSPPSSGPVVSLVALGFQERTARLQLTPYPGATQYELRVGTAAGASDLELVTTQTAATTWTLTSLPPSKTIYVTATAMTPTASSPGTNIEFYLIDFRKVIEAIFFQAGPYSGAALPGQPFGVDQPYDAMRGFVPGTRIRVLLTADLESLRTAAEHTAAQVADATGGALSAFVDPSGDNTFSQLPNTVKVVSNGQVCGGGLACSNPFTLPVWRSSVVLWGPDCCQGRQGVQVMAHELGHALLGLGHFGGYRDLPFAYAAGPSKSLLMFPLFTMDGSPNNYTALNPQGFDSLTPLEMDAVRAVYGAGLRPGATRGDFVARGLILP